MVSIVSAVRDLGRLRQIYVVLVRHGFGELAQRLRSSIRDRGVPEQDASAEHNTHEALAEVERGEEERRRISLPERVRLVCMDLGPSFVKLGQIASTRPDVLPAEWINELKKLQDSVTPLPSKEIKDAVEASLGAPLDQIYESFDDKPLAAASIGQVHRAVLKHSDGPQDVVVKVQRPGIRSTIASDLELLHTLAKLVERTIPESLLYQPSALVDQFDRAITSELDFGQEAEHAIRFAKNFEGHPNARFPRVYRDSSSKTVLTLELLPGCKVYEAIREHGHKGPAIAEASVAIVVKSIFEDGFFHADPHPGNILISGDPDRPTIGLIDLGMVGRLSPDMRDKTLDLMIAAVRQDHLAVADALYAIGTPTKKVDMRAYRAEVSLLAEKYLGRPLKEIDVAALISDLVRGANKYGIEIPADFLLVGKTIMTIEGVGKEIDPDLDVLGVARPYFLDLLRKRYSPERMGMEAWRGLERLSGAAYDLPQQLREILDDLRLGRLTLQTADPRLAGTTDRLGRRVFSGLVVATFVLSGTGLLAAGRQETLGYVLLALGFSTMIIHIAGDIVRRIR